MYLSSSEYSGHSIGEVRDVIFINGVKFESDESLLNKMSNIYFYDSI